MSERPITIVSLNVRGLGKDSNKQKLIKTLLASLQSPELHDCPGRGEDLA
jgi:hypothetical protein